MKFDNTYFRDLVGFYALCDAAPAPNPKLLKFNHALADELGLNTTDLDLAAIFSGTQKPSGADTLAQVYAGHQFGGFSPQLGDGRAILLGEIVTPNNTRYDIQLKGSGRTPFSRSGDGKAALGPVLREYLIAEAMHALNIPTTRALAAVTTGQRVQRETGLTGAVLTRIGSSHIRVGTFQFFAARQETDKIKQLANYAIARHYPDLANTGNPYLNFLKAVGERQANLIAKWMGVGFIHGVMNTDNFTISGETIDYGPCAFVDAYDLKSVFSSIDTQGRYAYGNQAPIARWNLARLAETLLPLIHSDSETAIELATGVIDGFSETYETAWLTEMRAKFGLLSDQSGDADIADTFLQLLGEHSADHTLAFRAVIDAASGRDTPLMDLLNNSEPTVDWLTTYRTRLNAEDINVSIEQMQRKNPIYIPRNHLVENVLKQAEETQDLAPFDALFEHVTNPYTPSADGSDFANPPPQTDTDYKTFCGT